VKRIGREKGRGGKAKKKRGEEVFIVLMGIKSLPHFNCSIPYT
jgi:hypothetical protein